MRLIESKIQPPPEAGFTRREASEREENARIERRFGGS
jgi:hypothetical protein